ncbi:hypothetical protein M9H77_04773 [Catharanthus roseus]|uniref:Uncharacterized protein n=1 Tax=Catharanthus roseus TaxID=4058 RepID=A0ACC0CF67_CATRO|nr:hypothetical protein M9H77_04773 [Catharanthus roseus]
MPLTSPPEVCVTKGRKRTNSTKRDKSYWEHVSIAHRKIQKSSGSDSGSSSGSGSGSGSRGRRRPPRASRGRGRGRGRSRGRSSLSSIIDPTPCSIFPYTDAFPTFIYPFIENWKNVIGDGNFRSLEHVYELVHRTQWQDRRAPLDHWLETPDSLYFIANAFNLCMILIARLDSTTVLPLYSYSHRLGESLPNPTLDEGLPNQWIHSQHFCRMSPPELLKQAARSTGHLTATLDHLPHLMAPEF